MESRKSSDEYNSCQTSNSFVEEIPFTTINGLNCVENSIYRNEFQKRIDFVLVFRTKDEKFEEYSKSRKIFETNLIEEGLILKHVESIGSGEYTYVHIFAPWDLLIRYAEVMKLRMPMKTIQSNLKMLFDEEYNHKKSIAFTAPYSRSKEYLFDIPEDREQFFTSAQRAKIVDFILKRKSFSSNPMDVFSMGINKLLSDEVYIAAYPLHEGKIDADIDSTRSQLIQNWASLYRLHKNQPLEQILEYFGVKIAIYFAWLGFYTKMLVPASMIGLLCFIYGVVTLGTDVPTNQICDSNNNMYKCPACANCNYTTLYESCNIMRASYIFDNPATIVFAVFMSLWATFYLEMWKRYSAKITYKWDLSNFDAHDEYPRPEYLARLANENIKRKINVITRMEEPYIPFFRGKLPHLILSSSFVLLCILLAIAIMLSIIAYRVSVKIAIEGSGKSSDILQNYGSIFTSLTAAVLNLICILIFDRFYTKLAFYLTERELPRTQFEFDNSLTLKMYLFQFVNYYSSIFYIAFFKGKFGRNSGELSEYIVEECPIGGCFLDLSIQLAIIMVGKQTFGAIVEILTPMFYSFYNKWKYTASCEKDPNCELNLSQWEEDFVLSSWEPTSLFYEYLELVIQFGFVTIFVSAFPLAPLFALINNFFEIRFDAKKIIYTFKRPVAQRVKSIGIWYRILDAIGKLSVITNGLIIAFTTSFIPRILYYIENGNLKNYLNSTLSKVKAGDVGVLNSTHCVNTRYFNGNIGYRESDEGDYQTTNYWQLLVARLAFVVVFENVIVMLTSLMRVLIPDVPKSLRQQKRLHSYLTNELIMRQELKIFKRNSSKIQSINNFLTHVSSN